MFAVSYAPQNKPWFAVSSYEPKTIPRFAVCDEPKTIPGLL